MAYRLERWQLGIVRAFAHACEYAIKDFHYDIYDFFQKCFLTEWFENFTEDFTVYSQGYRYIVTILKEELESKEIFINRYSDESLDDIIVDKEAAFWVGYLFMTWKFKEDISGEEIMKYDMDWIIDSYDVLHTQSINYAIDMIKENYVK